MCTFGNIRSSIKSFNPFKECYSSPQLLHVSHTFYGPGCTIILKIRAFKSKGFKRRFQESKIIWKKVKRGQTKLFYERLTTNAHVHHIQALGNDLQDN